MVPFMGGFCEFLGTFIGGVWAGMRGGSGVITTLISDVGVIVSGIVGGDVGTTLGSESGMVVGRSDLGGVAARRRIWATLMNTFLIVEPKVSSDSFLFLIAGYSTYCQLFV